MQAVLDENSGASRLTLNPTQQLPLDAFVPLAALQEGMGLAKIERSRRNPTSAPARVNTLFAAARSPADQSGPTATEAARILDGELAMVVKPIDIGLRVVMNSARKYVSIESEQRILDDALATAALDSAKQLRMSTSPVLAYLANELINAKDPKKFSMYSIVAGLDPVAAKSPPFGPFIWASPVPDHPLAPDEIVLNDWMAADLAIKPHDEVRMRYHRLVRTANCPRKNGPSVLPASWNSRGPPRPIPASFLR